MATLVLAFLVVSLCCAVGVLFARCSQLENRIAHLASTPAPRLWIDELQFQAPFWYERIAVMGALVSSGQPDGLCLAEVASVVYRDDELDAEKRYHIDWHIRRLALHGCVEAVDPDDVEPGWVPTEYGRRTWRANEEYLIGHWIDSILSAITPRL